MGLLVRLHQSQQTGGLFRQAATIDKVNFFNGIFPQSIDPLVSLSVVVVMLVFYDSGEQDDSEWVKPS